MQAQFSASLLSDLLICYLFFYRESYKPTVVTELTHVILCYVSPHPELICIA